VIFFMFLQTPAKAKALIICLLSLNSLAQNPAAQEFNGVKEGDQMGRTVILSHDGNTFAVAAPFSDAKGSKSGHIQVYGNTEGKWVQMGADIPGRQEDDRMGEILALSADGKTLAAGYALEKVDGAQSIYAGVVRIFKYDGSQWVKAGLLVPGTRAPKSTTYLKSVSLSNDGTVLAVGTEVYRGYVQVYQYANGDWTQAGSTLEGDAGDDYFGESLDLSAEGNIIAIGNKGKGTGQVKVYKNSAGVWTQLGNEMNGNVLKDKFGHKVSLSADGTAVAVSASSMYGTNADAHVNVYQYTEGKWKQVGKDIRPDKGRSWFGADISLSADGQLLAISTTYIRYGETGFVSVYKNVEGKWKKAIKDIDGEISPERTSSANNTAGWSISLSGDGKKLAVGYPHNDKNGDMAGQALVYDLGTANAQ
jgi:hypothetical protein